MGIMQKNQHIAGYFFWEQNKMKFSLYFYIKRYCQVDIFKDGIFKVIYSKITTEVTTKENRGYYTSMS